ncbi:hypothetical protein NM208_g8296 [Fusarium decemcellulare]|uniref:Uncharacterized protein n=1 Tax=Fusarium decemcellulare TaxID=57161 RepID=A0ACC1S5Y9_9HYPO|nr:hypothetical protein NM208_g8296 [Fusarium decemcellulare]
MKLSTTFAFASSLTTVIAQDISTSLKCFTTTILPTTTLYSYQADTNPTDIAFPPTENPQPPVPQFDQPDSATAKSGSLHTGAAVAGPLPSEAFRDSGVSNSATPNDGTLPGYNSHNGVIPVGKAEGNGPSGPAATPAATPETFIVSGSSRIDLSVALLGLIGFLFI